jgi:micrococcal nuclease
MMAKVGVKLMAAAIALLGALAFSARAEGGFDLAGLVIHVDDGDTVALLQNGRDKVKIRLANIDAPESTHTKRETGRVGQPYSENSRAYLALLVKGQEVSAHCFELDRYGRSVCELFLGGKSINDEMVRAGWAWANTSKRGRYLRKKTLIDAQATAKANRLGLWADAQAVPPWLWRSECWRGGECEAAAINSIGDLADDRPKRAR